MFAVDEKDGAGSDAGEVIDRRDMPWVGLGAHGVDTSDGVEVGLVEDVLLLPLFNDVITEVVESTFGDDSGDARILSQGPL